MKMTKIDPRNWKDEENRGGFRKKKKPKIFLEQSKLKSLLTGALRKTGSTS